MVQQSVRQAARREVLEALAVRRRERAEQEKRLEELGVRVAAALKERDVAIAAAERRAGQALRAMTEDEGLSVREALEWAGGPVTVREAARLVRTAGRDDAQDGDGGQDGAGDDDPAERSSSRVRAVPATAGTSAAG